MKKILFYTDTPLIGGAENQMLTLAKLLPKDKYTVSLACSSHKRLNSICQQFMALKINVQRLKVLHKHDPRHFFYLKKLLPNFDLMHMHLWNPASCRYGFLAAGKKPVVITEHDPFPLRGLKGFLKEKLTAGVKRIIVTSNAAKRLVLEQNASFEPLVTVIPNGIEIEEWKSQAKLDSRFEYRRIHFKTRYNEKIILCVAELHERKGQRYLIKAMQEVLGKISDVKLALVGEGPAKKSYEKLAKPTGEKIIFLGRRRDVAKLMASADIFVLPSVREAFGLVILEAATTGLPIIAANTGGIPEIIENGKSGILVTPQNAEELAAAIKSLIQAPAKAFELAKEARQKVELQFSAKEMAEKTSRVYDDVLN